MLQTSARFLLLTLSFLLLSFAVNAQKPPIDFNAINSWQSVGEPLISSDGKFVSYQTFISNKSAAGSLVIKSTRDNWNMTVPAAGTCDFTSDSRNAIYIRKDTLVLLDLISHRVQQLANVGSYQLIKNSSQDRLLIKFAGEENKIRLLNLADQKEFNIDHVINCQVADSNKLLVVRYQRSRDGSFSHSIHLLSIPDYNDQLVWLYKTSQADYKVNEMFYDNSQQQLIFLAGTNENNTIWHYRQGDQSAKLLLDNQNSQIEKGFTLEHFAFLGFRNGHAIGFDAEGTRFFFIASKLDTVKGKDSCAKVDIWNYKDANLQSQQLYDLKNNPLKVFKKSYLASFNLKTEGITTLTTPDESYHFIENDPDVKYIKRYKISKGDWAEAYWNHDLKMSVVLKSILKGDTIPTNGIDFNILSPGGHYLIGRGQGANVDCFAIDTKSHRTVNVTTLIPQIIKINEDADSPNAPKGALNFGGWIKDKNALLLYDKYDLWSVDPQGHRHPQNLTKGYGRLHKTTFRPLNCDRYNAEPITDSVIILSAFNRNTKYAGFYSLDLRTKQLKCLTMGPYLYHFQEVSGDNAIKAQNANAYVVQRQSSSDSPNLFITSDFKDFKLISDVHSEHKYNWLTSHVITYNGLNGKTIRGVLYKPEDFDPHKKYPVLIEIYEKKSDHANEFPWVALAEDNANIPWFVSHGYLVFMPDIKYTIGHPGKSALNSVLSAGIYLSKLKYVNPSKIGLSGHSWGAFQTNYIISHTKFFAAALSASGTADFISNYGSTMKQGQSLQFMSEVSQLRIGASLWQKPDLYIENSAIFRANHISTPLLMMNNHEDGIVSFSEGVEFFNALRRLQKKAWMLQYDGEPHSLFDKKNKEDYTIRMTQFFDHYLKDKPAPIWMTEGVPARLKGIESGYQLDTSGKQP